VAELGEHEYSIHTRTSPRALKQLRVIKVFGLVPHDSDGGGHTRQELLSGKHCRLKKSIKVTKPAMQSTVAIPRTIFCHLLNASLWKNTITVPLRLKTIVMLQEY